MKRRSFGIAAAVLLGCTLFCSACAFRSEGGIIDAERTDPAAENPAETAMHTVSCFSGEKLLRTEQVSESDTPAELPAFDGACAILYWETADGVRVDAEETPVAEDVAYYAVTGPALKRDEPFFAPGEEGLFHPYDSFTRSDAARAVYTLMGDKPTGETFLKDVTSRAKCYQAATALVTAGYMELNENDFFYPDVPITPADFSRILERLFSAYRVKTVLASFGETYTRAEAAEIFFRLLESGGTGEGTYYPDISPEFEYCAAVGAVGLPGLDPAQRPEKGFQNLNGYLYCVGDNGYFLTDTMVGTLYFDKTGQYTSGDEALDRCVAELIEAQTDSSMTREQMLEAVYVYVRDHYLYLKRNLYELGETGWEIEEALKMFQSGKGNCYNFTAAFWSLARGVGFDAICYSGLVGEAQDPHSWVEITFDGTPYIFDVETEMSNRLVYDYEHVMYKLTYEQGEFWSYTRPEN